MRVSVSSFLWRRGLLVLLALALPLGAQTAPAMPDEVRVRGTVIDAATGEPLVGITVRARVQDGFQPARVLPDQVRSGKDGEWALIAPRPNCTHRRVFIQFLSDTYGAVETEISGEVLFTSRLVRPVAMERGVRLSGRVIQSEGEPSPILDPRLEATSLTDHWPPIPTSSEFPLMELIAPDPLTLDATGAFDYPFALLPDRWRLRSKSHVAVSPPIHLKRGEDASGCSIELERGEIQVLAGRVVDESERPLKDVDLILRPRSDSWTEDLTLWAKTDADGRFRFERCVKMGTIEESMLLVPSLEGDFLNGSLDRKEEKVRFGQSDLLLRLGKLKTMAMRAKRAETGEPVLAFEVLCAECVGATTFQAFVPLATSDESDGVARIPFHREWFDRLLLVRAKDPAMGLSGVMRFIGGLEPEEVTMALHAAIVHTILLVDESGQPIAGAVVTATLQGPEGLRSLDTTQSLDPLIAPKCTVPWTERTSDDQGRVRFFLPKDYRVTIAVQSQDHLPLSVQVSPIAPEEATTCVLKVGATISGQIGPKEWVDRFLQTRERQIDLGLHEVHREGLKLVRSTTASGAKDQSSGALEQPLAPAENPADSQHSLALNLSPEGRFQMTRIPPGHWEVQWSFYSVPNDEFPGLLRVPLSRPLLLLGESATALEIDMSDRLPRTVSVSLTLNGEAVSLFHAHLLGFAAMPGGLTAIEPRLGLSVDGEQLRGNLPPGTYFLRIDSLLGFDNSLLLQGLMVLPDLSLFPPEITAPRPIRVDGGGPFHFAIECEIAKRITIHLSRVGDSAPIAGAMLFRRFSDEDPGEWLNNEPERGLGRAQRVSDQGGLFSLRYLAKGQHRIYIPKQSVQASWPDHVYAIPQLKSPEDPLLNDLIFLGTIDVQSDGQSFTLFVPDEAGWR